MICSYLIAGGAGSSSSSDTDTEEEDSNAPARATIDVDGKLFNLLKDNKRVYQALGRVHVAKFEDASDDTKELWLFVFCRVIKAVLPKSDMISIYSAKNLVTKEILMDKVGVSDEAMVWVIIMAKIREILAELKDDGNGTFISSVDESACSNGGGKGNGQGRGGGRKKLKRDKSGKVLRASGINPEVGSHQVAYRSYYDLVEKSRSSGGNVGDDANGWYNAIVERLQQMKADGEHLDESLPEPTAGSVAVEVPFALAAFTGKASDKNNHISAGFAECSVAMELVTNGCSVAV